MIEIIGSAGDYEDLSNSLLSSNELVLLSVAVIGAISLAVVVFMLISLGMMPVPSSESRDPNGTTHQSHCTRRFRSLSVSVDIDVTDNVAAACGSAQSGSVVKSSWERHQQRVLAGACDRYRTVSTNYIEHYQLLHHAESADLKQWKMKGMEMLRQVPEAFPFQSLPNECRLKVFSFLTAGERGIAAQVCRNWHDLIGTPTLWTVIDFTSFALCKRCAKLGRDCTPLCYSSYRSRLKSFFKFLTSVHPTIHCLHAAFDIGDNRDGWLEQLQDLVTSAHCKDLKILNLNWKSTPVKPSLFGTSSSDTWSTNDYCDVIFQQRHRQRLFVKLFDQIVAAAPNITRLKLPFDWSDRSIRAISRLRHLRTLSLCHYFCMHGIESSTVEHLIASATALQRLSLEIWTTSGSGLQLYSLSSNSLEHLDMSASRGVCLESVCMPRLQSLVISRQPLKGPLSSETIHFAPPRCLLQVLSSGAPALRFINGYHLQDGWKEGSDVGLETVLMTVCSCSIHTAGS